MTMVVAVGIAIVGATLTSLLERIRPDLARVAGLAAMVGLLATAIAVASPGTGPGSTAAGPMSASAFSRLMLILGTASGLALIAVDAITMGAAATARLASTWLVGLASVGAGLSVADPIAASAILSGGSLVAVAIAPRGQRPMAGDQAARLGGLRVVGVAGLAIAIPAAWAASAAGAEAATTPDGPAVLGLAVLVVVLAAGARAAAIPAHVWQARLIEHLQPAAVPLLFAWAPAAFTVVALGWTNGVVELFGLAIGPERILLVILAGACLVLGAVAAALHDDVEHVLGYGLVQDAGVILAAFAATDPATWAPIRTWIVAIVLARTAFAAWVVTIRAAYGTRPISDLDGWGRRSPLLLAALVLVACVVIGLPGLAATSARTDLFRLAIAAPWDVVLTLGALAALLPLGRLVAAGLRPIGEAVRIGPDPRPRWPGAFEPRTAAATLPSAIRANRHPLAATVVLALALVGVAAGTGRLGVATAAAEPASTVILVGSPAAAPTSDPGP